MTARFSISRSLDKGWQTMKKNFWLFAAILLIVAIVSWGGGYIADLNISNLAYTIVAFLVLVAVWVVSIIMAIGLIKVALILLEGKKAKVGDLFKYHRYFFNYILGSILYALIVIAGLFLLIVPGIIWAIKYQFFSYFIIDKNFGPAAAIKASAQITKGAKGKLFWFAILSFFINILGLIAFGIGLFVTIPTVAVATAYVYRRLLETSVVSGRTSIGPMPNPRPGRQD